MNELILALDTTQVDGSLALCRGSLVIEEVAIHSENGFGHLVWGLIESLLQRRTITVDDVDCFAAATGPGSFTGVRVGLACVKGLAEAAGKPAVGVSNLEALLSFGSAPVRAALLDARRGEVYGSCCGVEMVAKLDEWLAALPGGDVEIVSPDFTPFQTALADTRFRLTAAPRQLAGAVARIASAKYRRSEARDPAALDANYVRRSDAEQMWRA